MDQELGHKARCSRTWWVIGTGLGLVLALKSYSLSHS